MLRSASACLAVLALAVPVAPAIGQEAVTVKVAESGEYGRYLTDANGRALYLFTADTQGQGGEKAKVSCTGECLDRWPPLYTEGQPQAGEAIDESKLGTIEHAGKTMVTYNGWPLYYFYQDESAGQTTGQDIHSYGGEWYLVSPEGGKAEHG